MKRICLVLVILIPCLLTGVNRSDSQTKSNSFSKETIIDTLEVVNSRCGNIYYNENYSFVFAFTDPGFCSIGDIYEMHYMLNLASISHLSFNVPIIPLGYHLESATLKIYIPIMYGNSIQYAYPVFNNGTTITNPDCLIEHVDYGESLTASDIFPIILHPAQIFLNSYMYQEWITYDVTDWLQDDIISQRLYNSYRFYLRGFSDWDPHQDKILFYSSSFGNISPEIIYSIQSDSTAIEDDTQIPLPEIVLTVYPNPVYLNGSKGGYTFIEFTLPEKAKEQPVIDIYNLKGQKVRTIRLSQSYNDLVRKAGLSKQHGSHSFTPTDNIGRGPRTTQERQVGNDRKRGEFYSTVWDCKDDRNQRLASGIYIVKVTSGSKQAAIKMTILK